MSFAEILLEIVVPVLTLVAGGGWFVTYRAYKRKAEGEATQTEADGWKAMQDLYQQTINDFKVYCEDMRVERGVLKHENEEMRDKYKKVDDEIIQLKRQLARQGRKLEAFSPFLCSVVGCINRKKVLIGSIIEEGEKEDEEDKFIDNNI